MNVEDSNSHQQDDLLYPYSRYYGKFDPAEFLLNANLQDFAQKVNYICALVT